MSSIEELIDQSLQSGVMTQEEHDQIMRMVHRDGEIDEYESAQLSRLFSAVRDGSLKIIDTPREEIARKAHQQETARENARKEELRSQIKQAAPVSQIIDRAIQKGTISQEEHDRLMKRIHADGKIDNAEKKELSRLFTALQSGTLRITDSEREVIHQKKSTARKLEEAKREAVLQDENRESERKEKRLPAEQISEKIPSLNDAEDLKSTDSSEESAITHRDADAKKEGVPPCEQLESPASVIETQNSVGDSTLLPFMGVARTRRKSGKPFELHTERLLDINLNGKVWIKTGAMVGYYGIIRFTREGFFEHGVTRLLKKSFTGEGTPLTKASGQGNLYLADMGKKVSIVELEGHSLVVNGKNLLAFEETVDWDITLLRQFAAMWAGGFFNVRLSGRGMAAITTHYDPITLRVTPAESVMTDMNATVAWSGSLAPQFKTDVAVRTLIGRTSGETIQMKFEGEGFVVIQPYEESFAERELAAEKKG